MWYLWLYKIIQKSYLARCQDNGNRLSIEEGENKNLTNEPAE